MGNVKHMCREPLRFCKCYAPIIVSGRQVIPWLCNNDYNHKKRVRYFFGSLYSHSAAVLRDVRVMRWPSGLGDPDALCSGRYEWQETWTACQNKGVNPERTTLEDDSYNSWYNPHLDTHSLQHSRLSEHYIVLANVIIVVLGWYFNLIWLLEVQWIFYKYSHGYFKNRNNIHYVQYILYILYIYCIYTQYIYIYACGNSIYNHLSLILSRWESVFFMHSNKINSVWTLRMNFGSQELDILKCFGYCSQY